MKILVFLHELVLGGTTVNSIELAAALRDIHGHEVVLFATPGPMLKLVENSRIRFLPAPVAQCHPSPARMSALREAVRSERPDVIHVWETWPCFDAYYAVHLTMAVPIVVTDMQMFVTRRLPKLLTTTFGTPELVDKAKAEGRPRVELLLPPVDVHLNAPDAVDPTQFRNLCGIWPGDISVVTVSRLVDSMKGESLIRTLNAVRTLGRDLPLRLIIVGDGSARARIAQLASEINTELGRPAIVLTGAMLDPRAAYAAADVVVGMGSSSLRGLAFGKPVIVVGERAFSSPFTPDTAEDFYHKGFYGIGNGQGDDSLESSIRMLAEKPERFAPLGKFSRRFVEQRFSLEVVSARLSEICTSALAQMPRYPRVAFDALRTTAVYLKERRFLIRGSAPMPMECISSEPSASLRLSNDCAHQS
jgi:glycosyltransferase involved in cell wall biosynthesis